MGSTNEKIGVKSIPEMKFKMTSKMGDVDGDKYQRQQIFEDGENIESTAESLRLVNKNGMDVRSSKKIFESMPEFSSNKTDLSQEFHKAVKKNDVEKCLKMMNKKDYQKKIDFTYKDSNDWSPLHYACWNGNFKVLNM